MGGGDAVINDVRAHARDPAAPRIPRPRPAARARWQSAEEEWPQATRWQEGGPKRAGRADHRPPGGAAVGSAQCPRPETETETTPAACSELPALLGARSYHIGAYLN